MFTIRKHELKIPNGSVLSKGRTLFIPMAIGLTLLGTPVAFADNAVNLKVLVITTGEDAGLAYIKPILDEIGVRYDVLNAATQDLATIPLSPNGCAAAEVGCVGNYNGIILTTSDLVPSFTPSEWDALHAYETSFHVREAVLSGWPATYSDSGSIYLDYGLVATTAPSTPYNATWAIPTPTNNPAINSKTVFEYVNTANKLPITDWAFAAKPRGGVQGPRDGTVPSVTPLLKTPAGDALVSIIQYKKPLSPTVVEREVLLSTISNAWFLTHSQALSYEFINWVTQGVFVGGRFVHMANHLDDLFLANDQWNSGTKTTNPADIYRLTSADITNAVTQQNAFRVAHKTAGAFKLDFAFNGSGAVVDPLATEATLKANLTEDLVSAVVANKAQFRFINHTFTHADMDTPPVPVNATCDYQTLATTALIQAEITKNRKVWGLLGLPEKAANNQVLVSGNHSGLKDRKCTDEITLATPNPQVDDVPFYQGANPLFIEAAANVGVDYLASDTSQLNQATEQYITNAMVDDGSTLDRLVLPRFPANVFYNVRNPEQLVSEYNYIFHDRFVNIGQDPCTIAGAICTARNYDAILAAEATTALQHMLSFKKSPHFFHQANVANYGAGKTLQFDWLNSVYTAYEKLFKLPVKNYAYHLIGNKTEESLIAKSATINAKWDRTANTVTLSANTAVPNLLVTGITGGTLYGGQLIGEFNVTTTPQTIVVNQALTQ